MAYFDGMMDTDLSKVRDRGSKKLVAMMLPEHVALLREYNEEITKIDRPQLDLQELEMLDQTIHLAMEEARSVCISYFVDGKVSEYTGDIHFLIIITHAIVLLDKDIGKVTLNIKDISALELLDPIDIFE